MKRKLGRPSVGTPSKKARAAREPSSPSGTSASNAAFAFASSFNSFETGLAVCPTAVCPSDESSPEF